MIVLFLAASALAQDGPTLERFETRVGAVQQDGRGLESRAGRDERGRGSTELLVFEPMLSARIRQSDGIAHDVFFGVDVVTSASADALDALSSASRQNESFEIDGVTTIDTSDDLVVRLHWGGHLEEPLRSGTLGVGAALALDDTTLTGSFDAIYDTFDHLTYLGRNTGISSRVTLSLNATVAQVLSPTTLAIASYGLTAQLGTLETTYNSVPLGNGSRAGDLFPSERVRHALAVRVFQALPTLCTFVEAGYRFYADDFGVVAHTPHVALTHFVDDAFAFRLEYRFHTQSAPDFWTSVLAEDDGSPRTADSDLAALAAHELGGELRWYFDRSLRGAGGAITADASYLLVSYHHYVRSNELHANLVSTGWGLDL